MEHFSFISEKGKTSLPSKEEIDQMVETNQERYALVLDSSVCLEIINLVNYKSSARVDKQKIFNLLEYVQTHDVVQISMFALIELCYDRLTLDINEEKFWEFKNKLDFAFSYKNKLFRQLKYDYNTEYIINRWPQLKITSIKPLTEQLNISYAALLKIREIATSQGLSKQTAEKNITQFIDWMTYDLDFIIGTEYFLAIQVFGGNSEFRTMIKLDSSKKKTLKVLLGTAWDLFHARASRNRTQLTKIVGKPAFPIFVTKDKRLFDLLSPTVILQTELGSTKLSLTHENLTPPHYSDSFMNTLNTEMLTRTKERLYNKNEPDMVRVKTMIKELENNLT